MQREHAGQEMGAGAFADASKPDVSQGRTFAGIPLVRPSVRIHQTEVTSQKSPVTSQESRVISHQSSDGAPHLRPGTT